MRERIREHLRRISLNPCPWYGQKVTRSGRVGAGFLALLGIVVAFLALQPYVVGGKSLDLSLDLVANFLLAAYLLALFIRVAASGHAPKGCRVPHRN